MEGFEGFSHIILLINGHYDIFANPKSIKSKTFFRLARGVPRCAGDLFTCPLRMGGLGQLLWKEFPTGNPDITPFTSKPPCASRSSAHLVGKAHQSALSISTRLTEPVCDRIFEAVGYIAVSLSDPSLGSWGGVCVHHAWKNRIPIWEYWTILRGNSSWIPNWNWLKFQSGNCEFAFISEATLCTLHSSWPNLAPQSSQQ